jgi:hypothetical protein
MAAECASIVVTPRGRQANSVARLESLPRHCNKMGRPEGNQSSSLPVLKGTPRKSEIRKVGESDGTRTRGLCSSQRNRENGLYDASLVLERMRYRLDLKLEGQLDRARAAVGTSGPRRDRNGYRATGRPESFASRAMPRCRQYHRVILLPEPFWFHRSIAATLGVPSKIALRRGWNRCGERGCDGDFASDCA